MMNFQILTKILVQLGRSLFDAENFALAAFRFEQALSCGAPDEIYRESAKASQLSETTKTLWQISKNIYRFSRTKKGLG